MDVTAAEASHAAAIVPMTVSTSISHPAAGEIAGDDRDETKGESREVSSSDFFSCEPVTWHECLDSF